MRVCYPKASALQRASRFTSNSLDFLGFTLSSALDITKKGAKPKIGPMAFSREGAAGAAPQP
jgi:hypothetical protein